MDPKKFWTKIFLFRLEVEQKLKWIISKTFMTNSRPFKTALRLFQSCFKTIKDPQRLLHAFVKITSGYL